MSDSRERFEAWNERTPPRAQPIIARHTSDPNFYESLRLCIRRERASAWQACEADALERAAEVADAVGTLPANRIAAAIRELKP